MGVAEKDVKVGFYLWEIIFTAFEAMNEDG